MRKAKGTATRTSRRRTPGGFRPAMVKTPPQGGAHCLAPSNAARHAKALPVQGETVMSKADAEALAASHGLRLLPKCAAKIGRRSSKLAGLPTSEGTEYQGVKSSLLATGCRAYRFSAPNLPSDPRRFTSGHEAALERAIALGADHPSQATDEVSAAASAALGGDVCVATHAVQAATAPSTEDAAINNHIRKAAYFVTEADLEQAQASLEALLDDDPAMRAELEAENAKALKENSYRGVVLHRSNSNMTGYKFVSHRRAHHGAHRTARPECSRPYRVRQREMSTTWPSLSFSSSLAAALYVALALAHGDETLPTTREQWEATIARTADPVARRYPPSAFEGPQWSEQ